MKTESNDMATTTAPLTEVIPATLASISTTLRLVQNPPASTSAKDLQTYAAIKLYTFLADVANLTKAHATKLGLLTNPPIAESSFPAISRILLDITNGVLPVIASAPYIATGERYGAITQEVVIGGVVDVLRGLEEMIRGVEAAIVGGEAATGADKELSIKDLRLTDMDPSATKSSYTSTGQIWFSADKLLSISQTHLIGVVETKLKSHADMLNDCLSEFKEWVTEAAEELNDIDSGFDEDESRSNSIHADLNDEDDFFGVSGQDKVKMTKELYDIAEATQKKIKLMSILYTAMLKRRVKDPATRLGGTFDTAEVFDGKEIKVEKERNAERLALLLSASKRLAEKADDLAAAFYDGEDLEAIAAARNEFFECGIALADICKLDREGNEDAVSAWFGKFKDNVRI